MKAPTFVYTKTFSAPYPNKLKGGWTYWTAPGVTTAQTGISHRLILNSNVKSAHADDVVIQPVDDSDIYDIDVSAYKGSSGKLIRIKINPALQAVYVHVTISSESLKSGEIELGEAIQSAAEPGYWRYRTTRGRPDVDDLIVSVWMANFAGEFAIKHVRG